MIKSKWQEKGVCPDCEGTVYLIVHNLIEIESGKLILKEQHLVKCDECKRYFKWSPATGKITRAKSQSGRK